MTTTQPVRRARSRRLTPDELRRLRRWIAVGPETVKAAAPSLRVGLSTLHRALAGSPVDKATADRIAERTA